MNDQEIRRREVLEKPLTGAILHCFAWDFDTIEKHIPQIAAAGFEAIQTSPINAVREGDNGGLELFGNGKWYYHYQPTDWKIGNYQLGSREQFEKMAETAHAYGLKVIVDVVPNHTTPSLELISDELKAAAGGEKELFHQPNGFTHIDDFEDRVKMTTHSLFGLPDVDTENPGFQDYYIRFLNEAIEAGADGFRYDTAVHIGLPDDPQLDETRPNNFWPRVIQEIDQAPHIFNYGEVLQYGEARHHDYIKAIGRAVASKYGEALRKAFHDEELDPQLLQDWQVEPGDEPYLVPWVESHDNYIHSEAFTDIDERHVLLAYALLAARKDGNPLFFDRPFGSNLKDLWGENRIGAAGSDFWKDPIVRAVHAFKKEIQAEPERMYNPEKERSDALVLERGRRGLLILTTSRALAADLPVALKEGTYVDLVDGKTEYIVENGRLKGEKTIGPHQAVILMEGGQPLPEPGQTGIYTDRFRFRGKPIEVTFFLKNAADATYTLRTETRKTTARYTSGQTLKLDPVKGETVLELHAIAADGLPLEERYYFS